MKIVEQLSTDTILEELSRRLKEYRISADVKQEELEQISMVSRGTISRFENGGDISLSNFIKLLKALNLEENFEVLIPDETERPSYRIRIKKRRRVRKHENSGVDKSWKWGDEND
ncbi:MAG: helix-turn-helix transcriptional regulator [Oscillospiraceae bacterium]